MYNEADFTNHHGFMRNVINHNNFIEKTKNIILIQIISIQKGLLGVANFLARVITF